MRLFPAVNEVVGCYGLAVAPAGIRPETKAVAATVGRDGQLLGEVGDDVELVIDPEQSSKEMLDEPAVVRGVRVAGDEVPNGIDQEAELRRRLQPLQLGWVRERLLPGAGRRPKSNARWWASATLRSVFRIPCSSPVARMKPSARP